MLLAGSAAGIVGRLHPAARTLLLTVVAMPAFAGNSLLCRLALRSGSIDPTSFTSIRIVAGAATLLLLARLSGRRPGTRGSWGSAAALWLYAFAFSFAYVDLGAAIGTLLLFGAVQATMIGTGLVRGERPSRRVWAGFLVAVVGLGVLLWPGSFAGSAAGALAMLAAGVAWAVYSLRGRGGGDPLAATADNFGRAVWLLLPVLVWQWADLQVQARGALLAAISGGVTSGLGYVVWYAALRGLSSTRAALVQLTVPVLAACGSVWWLGEAVSPRLWFAGALVLGGVGVAVSARR